jgi:hypothetical protein
VTDDLTQAFRPLSPDPAGPPAPPPVVPDLRAGLGRLSRGLIAYGVIGLIVAFLGLAALVYVNARVDAAGDRVSAAMDPLATTLERTATALNDASTTAQTFSVTLDRTEEAVSSAADTIIGVRSNLETLRDVLRAVNILGLTPLGPAADAVGGIAGAIEGLDSRLTAIADGLVANEASLAANAASLGRLGDSTEVLAERLRSGVVEESIEDVQIVIVMMLLLLTALTVVPAVGALAFGVWLRRKLGPD